MARGRRAASMWYAAVSAKCRAVMSSSEGKAKLGSTSGCGYTRAAARERRSFSMPAAAVAWKGAGGRAAAAATQEGQ